MQETLPDKYRLDELKQIRVTAQDVARTLRIICGELRPPTLTPFGLTVTIESHANGIQEEHPEFEIGLHLTLDSHTLPEQMRLALFRIYQQVLDNVLQHADASHVLVRYWCIYQARRRLARRGGGTRGAGRAGMSQNDLTNRLFYGIIWVTAHPY